MSNAASVAGGSNHAAGNRAFSYTTTADGSSRDHRRPAASRLGSATRRRREEWRAGRERIAVSPRACGDRRGGGVTSDPPERRGQGDGSGKQTERDKSGQ